MTTRTQRELFSSEDLAIVDQYAELLASVPGPVSVWAAMDEGLLHLYTLVSPGIENLRAVFRVELELAQRVDPFHLDFDVYDRPEVVRQYFGETPPLFSRS